jgi:hypothetical protein
MRPATPCAALQNVTFVRPRFEIVFDVRGKTEHPGEGGAGVAALVLLWRRMGKEVLACVAQNSIHGRRQRHNPFPG